MANSAGDAHEYCVYGAHFRVVFPILDADGDLVTGAAGLDSECSLDQGTFADCTNEATEIATSSGMYYLDLTGAETACKALGVIVKTTTSGAKTTPMVLYPRRLPILQSGTAQAGAAGTITLASGASAKDDYYNGLFVLITNDSPAGAQYQLRRIIDYVGSTKVATIDSNWGTNPSSASTYDILIPEGYDTKAWSGIAVSDWSTSGEPLVTASRLATQAKADVNAEVVDGLNIDTYAEPGQEAPGATVSLAKKISYLYKAFRNKITQTAVTMSLYADDASTVDQKSTVSDDGTTFTRGEIGSGP
jgi:hypothetical protein